MPSDDLLTHLHRLGPLTAPELQSLLAKSQPTVSRLLRDLGPQVVTLGAGRATRYALPQPVLGLPARQPLHWIDESGQGAQSPWGELTLLRGGRVHVAAPGLDLLTPPGELPWFLAPLRAQGFLGRLLGQRLAGLGFDGNPERWSIEQVLYAASCLPDAPGAIVFGDALARQITAPEPVPDDAEDRAAAYDRLADDVAATLPAGSSAGGEQAKFLCRCADGAAELVKFSPPHGTPFGERWRDLLVAEAVALGLLDRLGLAPAAVTEIVTTPRRTCLVSRRFDRCAGTPGRRHVVALDALHEAFVGGPRQHWAASVGELARQRRVAPALPAQVLAVLHFGRLIGNTDMHFGNLSLIVGRDDVARGRGFTLAPLYDMLPMRWRPDAMRGDLDLSAFEPDAAALAGPARAAACAFWRAMADEPRVSARWRDLSARMLDRIT